MAESDEKEKTEEQDLFNETWKKYYKSDTSEKVHHSYFRGHKCSLPQGNSSKDEEGMKIGPLRRCMLYLIGAHHGDIRARRMYRCLSIPRHRSGLSSPKFRIKMAQDSREWEIDVECPPQHQVIVKNHHYPPSLFEICRRLLYEKLSKASKKLSSEANGLCSDNRISNSINLDNRLTEIDENNRYIINDDENGNNIRFLGQKLPAKRRQDVYTPADLVKEHLDFLPEFLKVDLRNGPLSRCENISCKKPVFDYSYYEFCIGTIILIDKTEEIILSASLCSKLCANDWKKGIFKVLDWTLR